jgi:hypothetical protein
MFVSYLSFGAYALRRRPSAGQKNQSLVVNRRPAAGDRRERLYPGWSGLCFVVACAPGAAAKAFGRAEKSSFVCSRR